MARGDDSKVDVIVSVDEEHLGALPEVVERLRSAGMEVGEALPALGAVTGSAHPSQADALAQVEGVSHVERSREIRLPPPDAEIQ